MDRSRKLNMAAGGASGGLLKRRHRRNTPLRDSPDETQERDRGSTRELMTDRSNTNSKPRREISTQEQEPEQETTEDEDDNETGDCPNATSYSSVFRNHVHRKSLPSFKVADEMIALSVPRKSRSASAKRLKKTWVSGNSGDDASSKKQKTTVPKVAVVEEEEEDIEIEIAEVLFGLMKQSSFTPNIVHTKDTVLALNSGPVRVASKKQKAEADDSIQIQDSSVKDESQEKMQLLSGKLENNAQQCDMTSTKSPESPVNSKLAIEDTGVATKEKSVSVKKELASCNKDSKVTIATSNLSEVEGHCIEKFKIDLMVPPPLISSPEQDGFSDKPTSEDVEMKIGNMVRKEEQVERLVKQEPVSVVELEDKKIKTNGQKPEPRIDLEKLNQDSRNDDSTQLQQKQQAKAPISKLETTAESSSVPLPIAIPGWPGGLPPLGFMPSFQTIMPLDGTAGSSAALQPPPFLLSQPCSKRCATHHYIASSIRLHQQFTKMNHFWPPITGPAALYGSKSKNSNNMRYLENTVIGNPLQGSNPVVNTNTCQEKGENVPNIPDFTRKDRSSEGANFIDTVQKKQVVLHQSPEPAAAANLTHGPAFIFSLTQHQAPATTTGSQTEAPKSTASSTLAAAAAAMSFSYPNMAANEAPYMTLLPNSGYSFPISAPIGNSQAFRGGNPAQALPFYNGSFYTSQILHPSQFQQQQSQTYPLIQPVHRNASSSSGSSSSHKQPQTQQLHRTQVSGNNFVTSTSLQSQQQQKQHVLSHQSRKLESNMSGESTSTIADTWASHSQKSVHGQSFMLPLQPNFALMPSITVGGSRNCGEKQQPQEKSLKGGVEIIPSQAFALSFASFNGGNAPLNLNFSAMAQNPTIFQSLPDMTPQGYQVISAPQSTQKKNYQLSEGKTGDSAGNPDDRKNVTLGNTSNVGRTIVFDNSARTLNFVSSPFTGNWPSCSITSNTNAAVAVNAPNSQKSQLNKLQKQHILHQQQPNGVAQSKTPIAHSLPSSAINSKFPNNALIFTQTLSQSNSSPQSPQWTSSQNIPATRAAGGPLLASNASTLENVTWHQGRATQGQISFGGDPKAILAPQGQQMPPNSQSSSVLVAGSLPSSSNLRTPTINAKAANSSVNVLQSQQSDNSSTGNGQKSSPVCGRDVPSILSTCPSHLSQLKY
ncbi:protein TIME FOR COFFEE isoform X2 [Ricinus communis]|uniref:ATP binding protein, putative n=1 Tax=Ricinus communis TaxID=3988 RepID=B9S416_RICCO|nr:protein TIME FOR COFFEE isoform X2 [Ricinus communis]EEF41697.1 ATP binding protein, putative [Ricinus communis]|eukprot:XP_002520735.1 protein TIME FOR COFFEE isoform X2 [Ricinus communis]